MKSGNYDIDKNETVVVLILNWNGWKDTLECLESVFQLDCPSFRVVVCDNDSKDGSLEKIKQWADGMLEVPKSGVHKSADQLVNKPIPYIQYDKTQAESGGVVSENSPLVLIQTGANLGFAGGNNVGLRYCLARSDIEYIWILNNDTVVQPDALAALVRRMQFDTAIGMCGSTLLYYHKTNTVQALGGAKFNFATGVGEHLGVHTLASQKTEIAQIEAETDYVIGASMLVSRAFLEQVGLMSESYFLYYEEIDWAMRAKAQFKLAWAKDSVVFHKEGASIGTSQLSRPSSTSLFYLYRNRLLFTRLHAPQFFWRVWRSIGFEALVYLKRLDFKAVGIILRNLFSCELIGASK